MEPFQPNQPKPIKFYPIQKPFKPKPSLINSRSRKSS